MTAVVAAIGAAFLAGAIALYREHRLEQLQLLVAARTVHGTFNMAATGLEAALSTDTWEPFNLLPGKGSFSSTWESQRADLAAHLTWVQWVKVEHAVDKYLVLCVLSQDDSPKGSKELLEETERDLTEATSILRPYCADRRTGRRESGRRRVRSLARRPGQGRPER